MGGFDGWRDYVPGPRTPATSTEKIATDRGSNRGAKRCIVNADLQIIDHRTAKAAGIKGEFFQSRKEAKFYIQRFVAFRAGLLRPLPGKDKWRQVRFPLLAIRPDGLKEKIADLVLDFAFERAENRGLNDRVWVPAYQDVKPGGGLREDTYILKKKWFESQYGITIEEL